MKIMTHTSICFVSASRNASKQAYAHRYQCLFLILGNLRFILVCVWRERHREEEDNDGGGGQGTSWLSNDPSESTLRVADRQRLWTCLVTTCASFSQPLSPLGLLGLQFYHFTGSMSSGDQTTVYILTRACHWSNTPPERQVVFFGWKST